MIMTVQTDDGYEDSFAYTGMTNVIPFLQPVIDARYGTLIGAEIICRVNTGKGITSNQFYIDKLASSDLADFIVAQLVLKTAEHLSQYKDLINDNFMLLLKMTRWQSNSLMLKDAVADFKTLFDGKIHLLFEIVEHNVASAPYDTAPLMNTLRVKSLCEETLANLQKENIMAVKLAPSLAESHNGELICKEGIDTIAQLAEKRGVRIIAEGVENATQKALLLQAGIYSMQGGLFSPPLSLSDFSGQLKGMPSTS